MTATALSIAGLCLPGCEAPAERGLELLRRELRLQIRPDGGHVSRNPSQQLAIVLRLQTVLKALEARRMTAPGFLRHMLSRTAAHLQLFRSGDGRLAVFNGGYEEEGKAVLAALDAVDADAAFLGFARHSGFQRLDAGRGVVIADTGLTQSDGGDGIGFRSAASFHFSSGRSRIVVNCGAGDHLPGEWAKALQKPAAHSCLSVEPWSAEGGHLYKGMVSHRRAEDGRGQLLEIERVLGDAGAPGRYFRQLFLSSSGDDLRGEDRLCAAPGVIARNWRIRFHLHPGVKASLARDGASVILALANKEGWRFRTNCPDLSLEKSTYCGARGLPVSTEQIVLHGRNLAPEKLEDIVIKWGFKRMEGQ